MATTAKISAILFAGSALALLASGVAHADVKISTKPTQNMNCSGGVCSPVAKKAILNATDLAGMLASGDVTVNTGGSLTQDIAIDAGLSWTSTHRLTLDAFRSIAFHKPVTVAGTGALTITTNDGGAGGDFRFFGKGHVEFWDLKSGLTISGQRYVLTKSIKNLRLLIRHNVNGFYALAKSINASGHRYFASPITDFGGTLQGLGNAISNLTITAGADNASVAFVGRLESAGSTGTVRDIALKNATIASSGAQACVGTLIGVVADRSYVLNSRTSGTVGAGSGSIAGGLACENQFGTIANSYAAVAVSGGNESAVGGLVGVNEDCDLCGGSIEQSYSMGAVIGGNASLAGGLVGRNLGGTIIDSYAAGAATAGASAAAGGLIGSNENDPTENSYPLVATAYSIGAVAGGSGAAVGGLIGQDLANPNLVDTYWDLNTSGVTDPSQGAGNIPNDPGIIGLTDAQLRSALPKGFRASVWRLNAKINNGYPYLVLTPPEVR